MLLSTLIGIDFVQQLQKKNKTKKEMNPFLNSRCSNVSIQLQKTAAAAAASMCVWDSEGGQTLNCVASVCLYSFKLITAQKQGGNETLLNPNSHH